MRIIATQKNLFMARLFILLAIEGNCRCLIVLACDLARLILFLLSSKVAAESSSSFWGYFRRLVGVMRVRPNLFTLFSFVRQSD